MTIAAELQPPGFHIFPQAIPLPGSKVRTLISSIVASDPLAPVLVGGINYRPDTFGSSDVAAGESIGRRFAFTSDCPVNSNRSPGSYCQLRSLLLYNRRSSKDTLQDVIEPHNY